MQGPSGTAEGLEGDALLLRALARLLDAWPEDREPQTELERAAARGRARRERRERGALGAGGFFPHQVIPMGCIQKLQEKRSVYLIHPEPSTHNRIELSARLDRMLIQVRDPRQTLVSWAHFIPEVVRRLDPPQGLHYGVPHDLFERPFGAQVDWHVEKYLPVFVSWMQGWIDCSRDPEFKTQILFVTHEELSRDPQASFARILDFYGIDRTLFDMPAPPRAGSQNVRTGQSDEWRSELTHAQQQRCAELIPAALCSHFGWPLG